MLNPTTIKREIDKLVPENGLVIQQIEVLVQQHTDRVAKNLNTDDLSVEEYMQIKVAVLRRISKIIRGVI